MKNIILRMLTLQLASASVDQTVPRNKTANNSDLIYIFLYCLLVVEKICDTGAHRTKKCSRKAVQEVI